MTTNGSSHGVFDRYMRDLDTCPPLTAEEERALALRMLRFRTRLVRLLGTLSPDSAGSATPEGVPGGADVPFPPSTDDMPYAALESMVLSVSRAAAARRDAGLEATARRARALLAALEAARTTFVQRNLRLTFHLARRVAGRNTSLPDLIQAGNVGLL